MSDPEIGDQGQTGAAVGFATARAFEITCELERLRAVNAELVAALREVLAWTPEWESGRTTYWDGHDVLERARAALAKAEGGTP